MTRAQFTSALAREPEHVRKAGKPIAANLKIIESKLACDEDKAAARVALLDNLERFEKARAG